MGTKQTTIVLVAKDLASGNIKRVSQELSQLGPGGRVAAVGLGATMTATSGVERGMSHLRGTVTNLASSIGLLAGGGALLSLGGVLTSSITKTEEFGASLEKIQMLTGETALASGALILQFQKFGLGTDAITKVVGFTEKSLGKLATTTISVTKATKSAELVALEEQKARLQAANGSTKQVDVLIKEQKARDQLARLQLSQGGTLTKLTQLDEQYGLHLVDTKGKVASFSETLSQLATFYDSNASASTKAYVASQVFGRGYTQMLPILNEGSAGLRKASEDAASLGLNSQDTVAQLAQFHDQMHELDMQTNLLQLSIGTALLPTLIELSQGATKFISDNRTGIVGAFKSGVQVAKDFAKAAGDIFGVLQGGWNMLPGPLQQFLVTGLVATKASKFLFGMSPIGGIKDLLRFNQRGGLGSILGGLTNRGSTPANPVFTADVTKGAGGLLGGAAEAGAGGLGAMSLAAVGGLGLAGGAALSGIKAVTSQIGGAVTEALSGNKDLGNVVAHLPGPGIFPDLFGSIDRLQRLLNGQPPPESALDIINQATKPIPQTDQQSHYLESNAGLDKSFVNDQKSHFDDLNATLNSTSTAVVDTLDTLHADLQNQLAVLRTSKEPAAIAAAVTAITKDVLLGTGGVLSNTNLLNRLKAERATATDPALIAALDAAIAKIGGHIKGEQWIQAQKDAATKIANSNEPVKQKLADLERIQKDLLSHGDTVAAETIQKLQDIITAVGNIHVTITSTGTGTFSTVAHPVNKSGPGKAAGGPVEPGVLYPVGEHGREYFSPRVPGQIIPNGGLPSIIHVTVHPPGVSARQNNVADAQWRRFSPNNRTVQAI